MTINIRTLRINISIWFLILLPVIWLSGYAFEYLAAYFSIMLHEMGHAAAASLLGLGIREVKLLPTGLSLAVDENAAEKRRSLILYSAGPLVNLALFLIFHISGIIWPQQDFFRLLKLSNLYLAIFNLIPVFPLDGGRLLREILAVRAGIFTAGRYLRKLTLLLSAIILLSGICLMVLDRINFTLFIAGFYILSTVATGRTEAAFMNIRQIVYKRSRFLKRGVYPARELVVLKTVKLGEILKDMDFDRFHFIHVLDENMNVIGFLSESELMEYLLKYDSTSTFEQLLVNMQGK